MLKKFFIATALVAILAGCAVVNWTGLSAIIFDGTQYPEITFGNGETISNTTNGTLDFGAANLTTTGKVTSTGAAYFASLNYLGVANNTAGTDDYILTPSNALTAYATGQMFTFVADTANTGACRINITSLGLKSLKSLNNQDPADNYIEAGSHVLIAYDGTYFQILSPDANP